MQKSNFIHFHFYIETSNQLSQTASQADDLRTQLHMTMSQLKKIESTGSASDQVLHELRGLREKSSDQADQIQVNILLYLFDNLFEYYNLLIINI